MADDVDFFALDAMWLDRGADFEKYHVRLLERAPPGVNEH
jgi:hypothetical protein